MHGLGEICTVPVAVMVGDEPPEPPVAEMTQEPDALVQGDGVMLAAPVAVREGAEPPAVEEITHDPDALVQGVGEMLVAPLAVSEGAEPPVPAGTDHVPSPRQNVEADAPLPPLRFDGDNALVAIRCVVSCHMAA